MHSRLRELLDRLPALAACTSEIERAFELLRDCYRTEGKVLVCGNGGSAADAEHWVGELLKGFIKQRRLPVEERQRLSPKLADGLQGALPMIPLTDFLSYRTAFSNDVDPELVFAQLVWALGRPGDVLATLSTSGQSANVCFAAEAASYRQMKVLALTGEAGGRLAALADVCIRVPAGEPHLVQEYHLPIYHCLSLMLEDEFFG